VTRATVCLLLAVIVIATQARGQSEQRALLPVKVDETSRGDVLSFIEGEDVFVPKSFLEQFALPLVNAVTKTVEGESSYRCGRSRRTCHSRSIPSISSS